MSERVSERLSEWVSERVCESEYVSVSVSASARVSVRLGAQFDLPVHECERSRQVVSWLQNAILLFECRHKYMPRVVTKCLCIYRQGLARGGVRFLDLSALYAYVYVYVSLHVFVYV